MVAAARQGEDGLVGIGRALAGDVQRDLSEVQQMLEDNVRFFSGCPEQTLKHYKRCTELCVAAMITLHGMGAVVEAVSAVAEKHDISPEVAGNGFWAQLRVLSCCLKKIKGKLRTMASERDSLLFGTRVKTNCCTRPRSVWTYGSPAKKSRTWPPLSTSPSRSRNLTYLKTLRKS